jgi:hypothetical protein
MADQTTSRLVVIKPLVYDSEQLFRVHRDIFSGIEVSSSEIPNSFFMDFGDYTEAFSQEYRPLNESRYLGIIATLLKSGRIERWAIYPNMAGPAGFRDFAFGVRQFNRTDINRQHMEEYKVCTTDQIRQYISVFYSDSSVAPSYDENLFVVFFDHIKRTEVTFKIPVRGKKVIFKRKTRIENIEPSPMNITGQMMKQFGDFETVVAQLQHQVEGNPA